MDSPQFNVVVDGSVLDGFETAIVLQQLQQQLKLPADKAQLLIAAKPVTIKRNVDESVANAYCARLRLLGVNARVSASSTTTTPVAAPRITPVQAPRYFSDAALATKEVRNTSAFTRAVIGASSALIGIGLGYAFIALLGVGLFLWYAVRYAAFILMPPIVFSIAVYVIVALTLATLAALILRPILLRPLDVDSDLLLSPLQEPALFAFVAQLCEKLALQRPEEIAFTTSATNTAAFLPGFKNLKHGAYRLTLSLPLLENTSLNQFAGLLAADLATQAKLPMLRYRWLAHAIVGRLNLTIANRDWLARRVDALKHSTPTPLSRSVSGFGKIVEQTNQYLQKIAARVQRIEAKLQRPLLHEQDRYIALIAGSDQFSDLMILRTRLANATNDAHIKNREDRIEGGLVDDLPALTTHYYENTEDNFARNLQRQWQAETTPRSDEPPIMRERIERIAGAEKSRLINDDKSASTLLQQRDDLARATTLAAYRAENLAFDATGLMPVDELTYAATQDILQRQQAAIYFNDWFKPFRFWQLADYQLISSMPLQDAAMQLSVCVNEIRRLTPDRAKALSEYERLHNQLREILIAQYVLAAGKKFSFRYIHYDGTTLVPLLDERQQDIAAIIEKLTQQEAVMGGRITLGMRLSGQAEREVAELHDALRLLHDIGSRLYKLALDCFQLEQLLQRHHQLREADYTLPIKKLETKIDETCTLLIVRLNDIPYPLDNRHRSLKSFVETILAQPATKQRSPILQRAQRLLEALYRVNEKLARQAADYGTIAEEAYRIEPIRLINS